MMSETSVGTCVSSARLKRSVSLPNDLNAFHKFQNRPRRACRTRESSVWSVWAYQGSTAPHSDSFDDDIWGVENGVFPASIQFNSLNFDYNAR